MTILENHPPRSNNFNKKQTTIKINTALLLSKLSLLLAFFIVFQQIDFLSTTEFIASCELSVGNIISVHAMIEVK